MKSIHFLTVLICSNHFKDFYNYLIYNYNYLRSKYLLLNFFFHSWNLYQFLNISKKEMTLIAYVFPKIQTAKCVVRKMSKRPLFKTPFMSQHVKLSQTLEKPAWQQFYEISSSIREILPWKISLLVIWEIPGHFVNTLTSSDKYSLPSRENFP